MATEQSMIQVAFQPSIKAPEATTMAVREVDNLVNNVRPMHTTSRSSGPTLRQPMFHWKPQTIPGAVQLLK